MATVKFFIQSKKDPASIYVRFSVAAKSVFKKRTGFVIDPNKWNKKNGLPQKGGDKNQKNLKTKLQNLANDIEDNYNDAIAKGEEISGEWLQEQIDSILNRKKSTDEDRIITYMQLYIENLPYKVSGNGKTGEKVSTVKKYKTLKKKIEAFEKYRKKKFYIRDVGVKFATELTKYFREVERLSVNTAGRYIKYLKTMCSDAETNGIKVHRQLRDIRGIKEKGPIIYLSFEELEQIEKVSLNRDALNNAREWLIIGCFMGQRFGDLIGLTKKNIKERNGTRLIELTQQKTKKAVAIPIHPKVKDYLALNNGDFPYAVSDQKFNKHIKEVCRIAGITDPIKGRKMVEVEEIEKHRKVDGIYPKYELITSHVCRRSFATNFYGSGLSTPMIMSITGHATEKEFLGYIGKTANDYVRPIDDFWEKQSQMAKKEPQMRVLKAAN